ncbi:MAG: CBS domain pair family protein [Candidatus Uhrbacteria bacterium GW2011_GWA2_52_8d]|uniref:CBS domain pair family protein n=1 Tax=Candidatus Uhrbacteria bacterium GW2011_GWA2_52_8d TaxID=1618979 RepID=A0A0G2AJ90_9BACT|nr:MAG: CBS domain pair family protein [Candidatus Uhrbacteria bacterium GW2011_GWA2_52_8d]
MYPKPKTIYADDDTESVRLLLRLRVPPLALGLFLGLGISILTSRFEEVLKTNVHVVFFLPFIVYIAAAVGAQTQAIYSRDLKSNHAKLRNYLLKEPLLGLCLGAIFGLICLFIVNAWLDDMKLALAVGLSMFITVTVAPIVALLITELLNDLHEDPAVGAAPIATVIQDMTSIVIYGIITSAIIL